MKHATAPQALAALPTETLALVEAVLAAADRKLRSVYLVGGPVRDLLLGRPLRDVDLIVGAVGGEGAEALAREAAPEGARVVAHERFGTVHLESPEAQIDLATLRSERYAHPGALPTIAPGDLGDDLRRRDFSVNALALPLSKAARAVHPRIVAVDDGLRDLTERRLRVLHPDSFRDDPTRALRAARLAPRLGFTLTRGSRSALHDALRSGAFGRVSGDRLRRELEKLFADARLGLNPAEALRLLADWQVLGALEPELALPRAAVAPLRRLGRAIERSPWRGGRWRPWGSGLAVWLSPLAPALRRRTLARFSVRGELAGRIAAFPRTGDRCLRALAQARGRGAIDAVLGELDEESLHALHALAPVPARRRIARFAGEDRWRRPPITGDDLVALGLVGPDVGRALARIRAAYLDGAVQGRDEAIALALELGRRRARAQLAASHAAGRGTRGRSPRTHR